MERIIRVSVVFTVCILIGVLSIVIANGKLTWATAGLVLVIVLGLGAVIGVWAVVHGQFPTAVEAGLTVGIVVIGITLLSLAMFAGADIRNVLKEVFDDASAWWLAVPIIGATGLSVLLERGR